MKCDHKFIYAGLRHANGDYPRPGSGASTTYYGHAYFCERCLEPRVERADFGDRCSYQKPLDGSAPASQREAELLVPTHDRAFGR
jgi:hypothetical protein